MDREILEMISVIIICILFGTWVYLAGFGLDKTLAIIILGPIGWVLLTRVF